MSFGSQLREFREEHLHITQKKMAHDLGVDPTTFSRYESDSREFPIELLQQIKVQYDIPDELFLALVLQRPLKSFRFIPHSHTMDSASDYSSPTPQKTSDLFETEPALQGLTAFVEQIQPADRQLFFAGIQNFIQLYKNLMRP